MFLETTSLLLLIAYILVFPKALLYCFRWGYYSHRLQLLPISWRLSNLDQRSIRLTPQQFLFICLFVLAKKLGLQDLSSPKRDWTQTPAVNVLSPNHWTTGEFPLHSNLETIPPGCFAREVLIPLYSLYPTGHPILFIYFGHVALILF